MAPTDRQIATLALAHALNAAERGLPVIPLTAARLPALPSAHRSSTARTACTGLCGRPGHGVHDATTDPAAVRALFAAAPHAAGYGIACGQGPHRLIGIDLDAEDDLGPAPRTNTGDQSDGALRQLALQHLFTIPPTLTVLTPGGGRHLWLTVPPEVAVAGSSSRLAPGVDVRGTGGYLIGPGSVTPHGTYRLAPGTAHLAPAPCPRTLLRLLTPPARRARTTRGGTGGGAGTGSGTGGGAGTGSPAGARTPRGPEHGEGLVHFVLAARSGQRNTRLFWAACRAYEHGFGDALAPALAEAAVRAGLPAHEARATLASAARLAAGRSEAA
ncbi:bifunctional DNA primase/polymerase [Streptomyces sp. NPDC001493]